MNEWISQYVNCWVDGWMDGWLNSWRTCRSRRSWTPLRGPRISSGGSGRSAPSGTRSSWCSAWWTCVSAALWLWVAVWKEKRSLWSLCNNKHQETCSCVNTYESWVFIETRLHKLFEGFAIGALQRRGGVFRDEEEHTHGVQVRVWRFSFSQLDGCDAQRPDISLYMKRGV